MIHSEDGAYKQSVQLEPNLSTTFQGHGLLEYDNLDKKELHALQDQSSSSSWLSISSPAVSPLLIGMFQAVFNGRFHDTDSSGE